jgi:transposase-like protein
LSGFLAFSDRYRDEASCIQALADLRWPDGFVCNKCDATKAYHLESRPRIYECAACGHQHSITAGTAFHKTRTDLRKWFMAAYLIGHDKRGVSAMMVSRELGIRYETAWLMCHKLRHALTESSTDFLLDTFIEVDEAFYGGRKQKGNRGRAQNADKAMIVCAVEKRPVSGNSAYKGINNQRYIAGGARIAVVANATADQLGGFIRSNVKAGTRIVSDGFKSYTRLDEYRHDPIVQGVGPNAGVNLPIVHKIFSNIKAWLNGTYHGVLSKHLPRYLREWSYRFNRRWKLAELDVFLLRRAVGRGTITYAELVAGVVVEGAASGCM